MHPDLLGLDRGGNLGAFADLLDRLPIDAAWRAELSARHREPWRRYHGPEHPGLLWRRHLAWGGNPADHDAALAIAFHDAVLVPSADDNEALSAALLLRAAPGAERAAAAIRATRDHMAYAGAEPLTLRLLDLDLTPLAEPPEIFAANTRLLRAEAHELDDASFVACVKEYLRRIQAAGAVFRTRDGAAYEVAAQANLTAALRDL